MFARRLLSSSGWLSKQASVARPDSVNRWTMVLPAFATHLAIGSPYGWSIASEYLTREQGFVVSAAADWSFSEAALPLSLVFATQGIVAALIGSWQMKVGPRLSMLVAGACFGGGMALGGLGVALHNLPLLYLGYGVLGGMGVGIAYTPPVQALIQWFPDRRGLASGLTIAGFGCGSLLFAPLMPWLASKFSKMPEYVGSAKDIVTETIDGGLFVRTGAALKEVVLANAADLSKLPYEGLAEGYYAVGTGSTGAAMALVTMGAGYWGLMTLSALAMKTPPPGYTVSGMSQVTTSSSPVATGNVHPDVVMKIPQFYLLGTSFFAIAAGGFGLFSVAKPMMKEVFSNTLPLIVTSSFATSFVMLLSVANLGGRIGWAYFSDRYGRKRTFQIFTMASVPLYLSIPFLVNSVVTSQSSAGLYAFMGSTFAAVTILGGTYALMPAYESDLFGSKYVGANHGRMLLASTAASFVGPNLLLYLRKDSEQKAITDLLLKADPTAFQQRFGADITAAEDLIRAKTLTINKLMEVCPPGTQDPTPFIYDSTMYAMTGLLVLAAISHGLIKPIHPKFFETTDSSSSSSKQRLNP